jgi:host factor-I protein
MIRKSPTVASPLQQQWLGYLRDCNAAVTLYLRTGLALRGRIIGFDDYALLLRASDGLPGLIYKHAISTVLPLNPPADPFEPADLQP